MGGGCVLLKVCLQHSLCFICHFLEFQRGWWQSSIVLCGTFFGGGKEGEYKTAWVSWERMCAPKDLGGLGLKDLGRFNIALLGKWRWRLFSEKGSVWTEVLKAKYFGSGKWGCNQLASVWWRDVWKSCFDVGVDSYDVWFEKGVVRKVGEGNEVLFWKELWVGTELLKNSFHKLFHL